MSDRTDTNRSYTYVGRNDVFRPAVFKQIGKGSSCYPVTGPGKPDGAETPVTTACTRAYFRRRSHLYPLFGTSYVWTKSQNLNNRTGRSRKR